MTEAEAVGALNGIADVVASMSSIWISVTFGYLTVSYFVGAALSRFQCIAISILYAVIALIFGGSAVLYVYAWQLTKIREQTIFEEIWFSGTLPLYVGGTGLFLLGGTLLSLYFMYDIRSRKTT